MKLKHKVLLHWENPKAGWYKLKVDGGWRPERNFANVGNTPFCALIEVGRHSKFAVYMEDHYYIEIRLKHPQ
ncbi:hypothetical protein GOBAR_DD08861 [Gossypium barbadense]|nr:hypothetical protein GOBAR_DD08861 [Gossypium barbadense]